MEDDYPDDQFCPLCGGLMGWERCWQCHGAGGFHDCGEDCCPCLDPEDDLNEKCDVCGGEGGYYVCGRPHPEKTDAGPAADDDPPRAKGRK